MSRNFSAAFEGQLANSSIKPVVFYECNLGSGNPLRFWSGDQNITWNGSIWLGNGYLHGISSIKTSSGIRADGATVTLTGVPSEMISIILNSTQQGALGKIWLAFVGNDAQVAEFTSANTERLTIADNAALSITGDVTISAWIKPTSVGTWQAIVSKYLATGDQRSYLITLDTGNKVRFQVSNDGTAPSTKTAISTNSITAQTWTHVVGRYDGVDARIYVNNGTPDTTAHTSGIYDSTADFFLGGQESGGSNNFGGQLRNVGIWNTALSSTQVSDLYNNGYPVSYEDMPTTLKANLVSFWDLNEISTGASAITRNDSHSTNHLTDTNTVTSATSAGTILKVEPFLLFAGLLDVPILKETVDAPLIEISYESELITLGEPNEHRYTDEGQRAIYPGDRGFEYTVFLEQWPGYWGRPEVRDD